MVTERQFAFVDEFGNPNLNLSISGTTTHFIVTAIIVDESRIADLEGQLELIRKNNFQTGEMRSQLVGPDDERRKKILNQIVTLDFHIYGVVVDKAKVYDKSGLQYKHSFYKFLNGLLYNELYKTFPNLKLTAHRLGSEDFMSSFEAYVRERHIPDLFNEADFGFFPSRSKLCLQLADFICGSVARCYDKTVFSASGEEFIKVLKPKIINIAE